MLHQTSALAQAHAYTVRWLALANRIQMNRIEQNKSESNSTGARRIPSNTSERECIRSLLGNAWGIGARVVHLHGPQRGSEEEREGESGEGGGGASSFKWPLCVLAGVALPIRRLHPSSARPSAHSEPVQREPAIHPSALYQPEPADRHPVPLPQSQFNAVLKFIVYAR